MSDDLVYGKTCDDTSGDGRAETKLPGPLISQFVLRFVAVIKFSTEKLDDVDSAIPSGSCGNGNVLELNRDAGEEEMHSLPGDESMGSSFVEWFERIGDDLDLMSLSDFAGLTEESESEHGISPFL